MSPILQLSHVSKEYQLVRPGQQADTIREYLQKKLTRPFTAWRKAGPESQAGKKERFWAVKDVSFDVAEGEVVGIIGRNGAGKSTLLKILSRITDPTIGSIVLRGRMASLLEVGTGFHPDLTGRENIFMNGAILGMRRAEITRKFDEIVAFAEVDKFLDTPVKHFSSGMYVRLAFSVAAHLDPEILIVDEVLAVGDVAFQKKCMGKMNEVSRGGRTVLFVTHNMAAIENLCQRAVVLEQGKLVFDGNSKEAVDHYLARLSGTRSNDGHVIDLTQSVNRPAVEAPRLVRMEFYTDEDRPLISSIGIAGRLKVCTHFILPNRAASFDVGLGFNNAYGQRILTLHSTFQPNRPVGEFQGEQCLTCDIPSLTLLPGEYSISVWLNIGNVTRADAIENAAHITVQESDFYGTGKVPGSGTFVLKHQWLLE
jgi:lipopolysaccharide transport system ATP-binding protein